MNKKEHEFFSLIDSISALIMLIISFIEQLKGNFTEATFWLVFCIFFKILEYRHEDKSKEE